LVAVVDVLAVIDEPKKPRGDLRSVLVAMTFAVVGAAIVKNEPASHPLHTDETPLVEDSLAFTGSARSSADPAVVEEIFGGRGE
jgi:hypothetical protein